MQGHKLMVIPVAAVMILTAIGCDEDPNRHLAEMTEKYIERQAAQGRQMAELQHEVAKGARRLVEADAETREDMVALQREVQGELAELGRQRDLLEDERRQLATSRYRDPIIAAAVTDIGFTLACLLPLVVCWYFLHGRVEPADDQAVVEVLLEDLVIDKPLLLPRMENVRAMELNEDEHVLRLSDGTEHADESAERRIHRGMFTRTDPQRPSTECRHARTQHKAPLDQET